MKEKTEKFLIRIDKLTPQHKALWGQMNVQQMICHCADQFRMALGEKKSTEYGMADPDELRALARAGKTTPTPKGFDQVKGEGTPPVDFEQDKITLKNYLKMYSELPDDYKFSDHPYFGKTDKRGWNALVNYHLNHHLKQFGE